MDVSGDLRWGVGFGAVASSDRKRIQGGTDMARGLLVALVNVPEGRQEAFEQWYIKEHIDHTAQAPHFLSGNVYRLAAQYGDFGKPPQYLAFYELDTDDHEEALKELHDYNASSGGHGAPADGQPAAEFAGAGWYVFERSNHTKG